MAEPNALAAFTPGGPAASTPAPSHGGVRQIAPNVALTDFNDESVRQYEFELYTGKTNVIDRIYIVNVSDIVKGRVHYHDKLKGGVLCQSTYVRNANGTQENLATEAECCRRLGAPQQRFAALIVKYGTDNRGNIVMPFSFEQRLWKFGSDKFVQLRNVNRDFPLERHDLSISCSDEQYQKMQIGAKPDCLLLHPNFPAAVKQQIEDWAKASVAKMPRELGRTYTDQELLAALQQAGILTSPGAPAPTMAADAPVANFADVLGSMGAPAGDANTIPGQVVSQSK